MAKSTSIKNKLSSEESKEILKIIRTRFEKNIKRHKSVEWQKVEEKLLSAPAKLWSLYQMEMSGGEPDLVLLDPKSKEFVFVDCSEESPKGRRSVCYDEESRVSRKEHAPKDSALEMAEAMGIEILNEEEYRGLQKFGEFDTKTSSWIKTPNDIRKLGGALFCDRRYNAVFTYHNGVQSYYAARAFRGLVKI